MYKFKKFLDNPP